MPATWKARWPLCALDVEWPNGMEGGTVHGHEGVREYWTRQWGMINPHVDPVSFELDSSGDVVVGVHQVVRDLSGKFFWTAWSSMFIR